MEIQERHDVMKAAEATIKSSVSLFDDQVQQYQTTLCDAVGDSEAARQGLVKSHGNEAAMLRTRLEQLVEESECPVCFERPAGYVLSPCGHCFCCDVLCPSSKLGVCPMCCSNVDSRIRVHGATQTLGEMMVTGDLLGARDAGLQSIKSMYTAQKTNE